MSIGAQKPTHQDVRSGADVCFRGVPDKSRCRVDHGNMASARNHCRDSSGLHHRLAGLRPFPEWRKMVGTLTKKEWAYA